MSLFRSDSFSSSLPSIDGKRLGPAIRLIPIDSEFHVHMPFISLGLINGLNLAPRITGGIHRHLSDLNSGTTGEAVKNLFVAKTELSLSAV
jgi:hypothetical protein